MGRTAYTTLHTCATLQPKKCGRWSSNPRCGLQKGSCHEQTPSTCSPDTKTSLMKLSKRASDGTTASCSTQQAASEPVPLTFRACTVCRVMVQLLDGLQGLNGEPPQWHADRLVFINDVYFCARDAVRLLQHVSADLACSMDFLQWKDPPSTVNVYPYGVDGPPLSVGGLRNSTGTQGTCSTELFLAALSTWQ